MSKMITQQEIIRKLERELGENPRSIMLGLLLRHFKSKDLDDEIKKYFEGDHLGGFVSSYSTKLFDKFFSYAPKGGVIQPTNQGMHWGHVPSGFWFLNQFIENHPKREIILDSIDLEDSYSSFMRLGKMKIAEGFKLAEVAGSSYATLTALLGGEGTFWYDGHAGIISPIDLEEIPDRNEKIGYVFYLMKHSSTRPLSPSSHFCKSNSRTFDGVFNINGYDIFMAVNYGHNGNGKDLEKVAKSVLRENRKEHHRITFEDHESHYLPLNF